MVRDEQGRTRRQLAFGAHFDGQQAQHTAAQPSDAETHQLAANGSERTRGDRSHHGVHQPNSEA